MKRSLTLILLLLAGTFFADAQELACKVAVNAPNLQLADPSTFETLENDLFEFMNNRKWGTDDFSPSEKIVCNISINITEEVSQTRFRAEIIINASRPVYDSAYNTTVFRHQDKDFEIDYAPFTPIEFDEDAFLSNITSVLAFYAYTILAYDYDSFSLEGGTPYLQKAKNIVDIAASEPYSGWKAFDGKRNRYWLVENLLNSRYRDLRSAYYKYHLQGLDVMADDIDAGRTQITQALEMIGQVDKNNPSSMATKIFANTKEDELVNIFKDPSVNGREKAQVLTVLSRLDPGTARRLTTESSEARKSSSVAPSPVSRPESLKKGR